MSGWTKGQAVSISGGRMLHVERVTRGGKAVVDGRTFDVAGREVGGDRWHPLHLLPWTDELEAKRDLAARACNVSVALHRLLDSIEVWRRDAFRTWGGYVTDLADVERAERTLAALQAADPTKGEGEV